MSKQLSKKRCSWAGENDPIYVSYHDEEWGVPVANDQKLFEFMVLESAQAGLSWRTILGRREGYKQAFKNFDPKKVAAMTEDDVERLLKYPGIIRNRLKIRSAINNAKAFLKIQKEYGSFASYMWSWSDGKPIMNTWSEGSVPVTTELAINMSKELKNWGFSFLGPTIWYAHMQAVGMVNDHTVQCFRYEEIRKLSKKFKV